MGSGDAVALLDLWSREEPPLEAMLPLLLDSPKVGPLNKERPARGVAFSSGLGMKGSPAAAGG